MTACINRDPLQLGRPEAVRRCLPETRRHKAQQLKLACRRRCRESEMVKVVMIPVHHNAGGAKDHQSVNAYCAEEYPR